MLRGDHRRTKLLGEDGRGPWNTRCYWAGASTGRSVVTMAKIPSALRAGTARVIIQISPPPASKYGAVQMPVSAANGALNQAWSSML